MKINMKILFVFLLFALTKTQLNAQDEKKVSFLIKRVSILIKRSCEPTCYPAVTSTGGSTDDRLGRHTECPVIIGAACNPVPCTGFEILRIGKCADCSCTCSIDTCMHNNTTSNQRNEKFTGKFQGSKSSEDGLKRINWFFRY